MQEIGWFYLVNVEKGLDVDSIYDLTAEIELDAEVMFMSNIDSDNMASNVYLTGFYLAEMYEDSSEIEKFLVEICNEVENLEDKKAQDLKINLNGTEYLIKILR